jgi:TonB family protein
MRPVRVHPDAMRRRMTVPPTSNRVLTAFGVLLLGALGILPASAQSMLRPEDLEDRKQACGRVVSISCRANGSSTIVLNMSARDPLSIDVKSGDDIDTARRVLPGLLFRRVCATGQLVKKGNAFEVPKFSVRTLSDVVTQEGDPTRDWVRAGVFRTCDAGVELPKLTKEIPPQYPVKAMQAGLEGAVVIEAIVEADGTVSDVHILRSLDADHGLDEEAIRTAKSWRFDPARKDGRAVPMVVTIELTFSLRSTTR